MTNIQVTKNTVVKKGDPIGKIGDVGNAHGAHLHFGINSGTNNSDQAYNISPYYVDWELVNLSGSPGALSWDVDPEGVNSGNNPAGNEKLRDWKPSQVTGAQASYLKDCTYYPTYMTVKVSTAAPLWSLPCSASTDASSEKIIESMPVGTQLTVTAVYGNTASPTNYWYKATTADGTTGYVYSARATSDRSFLSSDVVISGATCPSNPHTQGNAFSIAGDISAKYNKITTVAGGILSGGEVYGDNYKAESVSGNYYALKNSAINTEMKFKSLPAGD